MDSFFSSFNQPNYSIYEEQNDSLANISSAMNRSKLLLSEMIANPTPMSNTPSRLLKTSMFQQKSFLSQSLVQDTSIDEKEQQSSIYTQFKIETNKYIDEESNLIELLKSYSDVCSEHTHFLKEKLQHLNINRQKELYNSIVNEQEEIEKEKNLWNLIYILFKDKQESENNDNDENNFYYEQENYEGLNETAIVKNLIKKNSFLRRVRLVIDWLEKIAAESNYLKMIRDQMSSFPEKSANWEHTLHHLKSTKEDSKIGRQFSSRDFVDELDPDAPIRLNKPLHDLDQEDEYKLMECIFAFIRAGDLNSARDFCLKIGQPWRAATLEGFKLFNDKNYDLNDYFNNKSNRLQEISKNEGNLNRDIWRLMVHKLIKDEHFNQYEKAVYASLVGFVSPVLPICKTFSDYIWVYFKALYYHIIEKEIRQKITNREFLNVPYDPDEERLFMGIYKNNGETSILTIDQIFERIQVLINNNSSIMLNSTSSNISVLNTPAQILAYLKADAEKPISVVLKYIIKSGINGFNSGTIELMDYLKTLITSESQIDVILRFSAHLALFYRTASFKINDDSFIQILDTFVEYLIENKYKEIIAYYLSQLTPDIQKKRYSKFLQTISDNKERLLLIKLAKERNMNVQAITEEIVDNLSKQPTAKADTTQKIGLDQSLSTTAFISKTAEIITSKKGQILNEEDKTKINAIDWIVYDPSQRFKLLEYANLLMRYFLLERQNFEATKTTYSKIPNDTITIILTQHNYQQHTSFVHIDTNFQQIIENLPKNVTNSIKEYLCFKEYIEAINLYNDWFDYFHREKPTKPVNNYDFDSNLPEHTYSEKIKFDFEIKQYDDLMSRWHSKALFYSEKVKTKFYSVLKFPFGGWMNDIPVEDLIDEDDENSENEETNMDEDTSETNMEQDSDMSDVRNRKTNSAKRKNQMLELRKLYLPNICFVLVDVLSKMELNKEIIRISDLVASENYKLYSMFTTEQLECLIDKIADASINLLDSNNDFLGYN